MKIKCAYCKKIIEQSESVKSTLVYTRGWYTDKKEREYCSKQCAENDQMAHEH
ncbi:YdaE family protein [Kosakonia sacchari]|uniref:YdaE family protein n=1 Tax=Kosakonia sacchari TaxID=1158459 RepID=UPI0020C801F0|nr:YdaE family protein [Kosakonia sacchari]